MHFFPIYWFCWRIVLICVFRSNSNGMCVCVCRCVFASPWLQVTHGPYQMLHYLWLSEKQLKKKKEFEKTVKNDGKWKIKYQTETKSTDSIAVNGTTKKQHWLFSVEPRKITCHNTTTNQHKCHSQIVALYSIGLKYLFRIFYLCFFPSSSLSHSFFFLVVNRCLLPSTHTRCGACEWWRKEWTKSSCIKLEIGCHTCVFIRMLKRCCIVTKYRLKPRFQSHAESVCIHCWLFACLLYYRPFFISASPFLSLKKNTELILYHYNKTMFDNREPKRAKEGERESTKRQSKPSLHAITMNANINVRDWCHTHHPF